MRKVRTSGFNSSPALMFSRGVEQIISDHMSRQSKFDDQELLVGQRSPKKQADKGSLFSILIQQLFWQKTA
jgi:hypothetical protein